MEEIDGKLLTVNVKTKTEFTLLIEYFSRWKRNE
jgi:hypothetical protein